MMKKVENSNHYAKIKWKEKIDTLAVNFTIAYILKAQNNLTIQYKISTRINYQLTLIKINTNLKKLNDTPH